MVHEVFQIQGCTLEGSLRFAEVTVSSELRRCPKCKYETLDVVRVCPNCGRRLLSVKQIKRLGWVQLILGLFLVVAMGAITFFLAPLMLERVPRPGGPRFTGSAEAGASVLGLFGLVILFGLTSMAGGLFQITTGRRNKFFLYFMLVLVAVLIGWVFHVNKLLGSQ